MFLHTAISQWAMEMLKMQSELMLQAKEVQEKRDAKNIKRRAELQRILQSFQSTHMF